MTMLEERLWLSIKETVAIYGRSVAYWRALAKDHSVKAMLGARISIERASIVEWLDLEAATAGILLRADAIIIRRMWEGCTDTERYFETVVTMVSVFGKDVVPVAEQVAGVSELERHRATVEAMGKLMFADPSLMKKWGDYIELHPDYFAFDERDLTRRGTG